MAGDGPARCRFAHHLVSSAIVDALTPLRRAAIHRRIGLALESRPGAPAAELAWHFVEAASLGEHERAARHTHTAASEAMDGYAYEHAADAVERALAVVAERDRALLLTDLGEARWRAGEHDAAHRAFREAETLAASHDLPLVRAVAALGAARGRPDAATMFSDPVHVPLLSGALDALNAPGDTTIRSGASLGDSSHPVADDAGDLRLRLLGALAVWDGSPDADARVAAWVQSRLLDIWAGRVADMIEPIDAAVAADAMGDGYRCARPLVLVELGRCSDAVADIADLATLPRHGLPATTAFGACAALLIEACGRLGAATPARIVSSQLGQLVDLWATIPILASSSDRAPRPSGGCTSRPVPTPKRRPRSPEPRTSRPRCGPRCGAPWPDSVEPRPWSAPTGQRHGRWSEPSPTTGPCARCPASPSSASAHP